MEVRYTIRRLTQTQVTVEQQSNPTRLTYRREQQMGQLDLELSQVSSSLITTAAPRVTLRIPMISWPSVCGWEMTLRMTQVEAMSLTTGMCFWILMEMATRNSSLMSMGASRAVVLIGYMFLQQQ